LKLSLYEETTKPTSTRTSSNQEQRQQQQRCTLIITMWERVVVQRRNVILNASGRERAKKKWDAALEVPFPSNLNNSSNTNQLKLLMIL
jgi:hypothetical protein